MTSARPAVVAGATGLVGSQLLPLLLQPGRQSGRYARAIALARRPPQCSMPGLEVRPAQFDRLASLLSDVGGPSTDVFCCLGTTIGKAGSEAAFRQVDFDYPLALARWAAAVGARRFLVVSALGANAGSRVFYNRVKGELEAAVAGVGLASLVVLRPSLLAGARAEFRLGERLTLAATAPLRWLLPAAVRPVQAADVAAVMVEAAQSPAPPALVTSREMQGAYARLSGRSAGASADKA